MSGDLTALGPDGIRRSYDEHYDTMMDVEQDPTGAWQAIQKQADRIEELEAEVKSMAMDCLVAKGQASDAYQAQLKAEAKLAKAVEALRFLKSEIRGHGFSDEGRMLVKCNSIIAELTGGKDD